MGGLEIGRYGRPVSSGLSLTAEQEKQIQRLIQDHRPEELKMDFALWTRAAVMQFDRTRVRDQTACAQRWNVSQALGIYAAKPIRRAYEQSPAAVQKWLDETYH